MTRGKMESPSIYVLGRRVTDLFHAKGFSDVKVQFMTGPVQGDGLIGTMMFAKISAVKERVTQQFNTVLKCSPTLQNFRKSMPVCNLFRREILYYTKIVPIYDNLQDQFELCVPQGMRCLLPKCYATCDDMRRELIILEDLTKKGYSAPILQTLDYAHASIILRIIAKLHCLSFIYEERYPERFKELKNHIGIDGLFKPNEEFSTTDLLLHGEKVMRQFTDAIIDESLRNRSAKVLGSNAYEKFLEINRSGKIKTILHGDNWHCNYMFKYKDAKPIEAMPIDFQWARYGSIGYDFVYLFVCSIQGELRRDRFYELVDEYYSAFNSFMTLCGYEANRFCSYEQFKEEVKGQALTCPTTFMISTPFFKNPGLRLPELLSSSVYTTVSEEYILNVNSMVEDLAHLGLI